MTGVQHEIKTDPFYFSIVVQDRSLTEHDLSVHVKEKRFLFVIFDQNALALPLKQRFVSADIIWDVWFSWNNWSNSYLHIVSLLVRPIQLNMYIHVSLCLLKILHFSS